MCVRWRGKDTKLAKEQARKDRTDQGRCAEDKEQMNGRVAKETMEVRRVASNAPRAANLIGTVTKTEDLTGTQAEGKAKARAKLDIATGVNCPYKWTNSIDEEDDQSS